ncbi:DUF6186 family protein [Curtobacterium ammoniigenes]|uniref:DUF6186 family protein n=1 Tax=Curtobacterium ammoniigenes TaxID=395387 RepID=UPI000831AE14|nr:DUF6186 family protein [Curtobacterium ammoniigenes]
MMHVLTTIVYATIGLAGLTLVIVSRRIPDRIAPASTLLNRVLRTRAARITVLTFWWWLGWHFFVSGP